ncbi:o-succinylbenzoate--CoA ligase [Metabacillus fastidiosus]|uniref:2-succinylbenzoate--CoA ligase n=1 Tax=Metabacillus fastidiosus TaxID=1458 RepID=A0ABU6NZK6_9BACI|nr:o-succinylbenzoate--CoA ligase [Metabacillus fastidiosus]MED4401306.1 o-succinylbenzoate--CoA ligase [Metabacillus fastidiosus]MED4453116.1 o-succinylbenzoate--CoA ligase [Metabacillus fastidiosus]MED4464233.1 o-succinylbenzoate--CoA ligase [Metabacillus fastidiosus]
MNTIHQAFCIFRNLGGEFQLFNEQSVPNWLEQRAFLTPDRVAIKTECEIVTFKELYEKSKERAYQLKRIGINKDDHIAVLMKNSIEMVTTIHGLMLIGAVTVLLNTKLSETELSWQIKDVQAVKMIYDESFQERIENINEIEKFTVHMLRLYRNGTAEELQHCLMLNDVATIMYTSGTTGYPKGVMQTYGNHFSSAINSAINLTIQADDKWLVVVPLFHISGLSILMRSVIYGMGIIIHERFDARLTNKAIMDEKVTIVSVVTTMLQQMLEQLGKDNYPKEFRCMLLGGGPAPKPVLEKCRDKDIPVFQTYGMTETSSQIATLSAEYSLSKLGSAGKPLFQCEIKIMDNDCRCAPYEEGEIVVKGPNVTNGYWKRDDATSASIKQSWFYTGDIGFLDEDGFLFVLDRRSDLIISGGENIYPAEIEAVLLSHPAVKDVGVSGVEDEKWGEVPCGFVIPSESVTESELIEYCKKNLASYKTPKKIFFVDHLPRNAANKLMRRNLRLSLNGDNNK